MIAGVTIVDPPSTFIDAGARIGADSTLHPNSHIIGDSSIQGGSEIGPGALIRDSAIGARCRVLLSTIEDSTLEDDVEVGPYSHVRPASHIGAGVHIGNFAETKASRLGRNTKMGHFSYLGDADVGTDVNIGAGTITANYDGERKHPTIIGDGAFIGSDTMLVAPVRIGRGARTAAGSVVTRDVPDGAMAVGAPARIRSADAGDAGTREEDGAGRR
jgi:bifunctional UDP-N-acetylglucosamine pyrophosphorylase/glucosamine-1-phosphate N-acetyltransferase